MSVVPVRCRSTYGITAHGTALGLCLGEVQSLGGAHACSSRLRLGCTAKKGELHCIPVSPACQAGGLASVSGVGRAHAPASVALNTPPRRWQPAALLQPFGSCLLHSGPPAFMSPLQVPRRAGEGRLPARSLHLDVPHLHVLRAVDTCRHGVGGAAQAAQVRAGTEVRAMRADLHVVRPAAVPTYRIKCELGEVCADL